jgi:diguanylate cyclase (GGDEF)-like protein
MRMKTHHTIAVGAGSVLLALLVTAVAKALFAPGDGQAFFDKRVHDVILVGAGLLVLYRGMVVSSARPAWLLLGSGMLIWALGNIYYSTVLWDLEVIPVPSPSDALWIAFYPLFFASLILLLRQQMVRAGGTAWLDGALTACSVTSLAAATVLAPMLVSISGRLLPVLTNLSYPILDLLVLGAIVGAAALHGWRLPLDLIMLAIGGIVFTVFDMAFLYMSVEGTWVTGNVLEAGWPLAMVLFALAAWIRSSPMAGELRSSSFAAIAVPCGAAVISIGVLVRDHFAKVNLVALGLATLASVGVVLRLYLSFRSNLRMIREARDVSLTDPLTELGNRRMLAEDLEAVFGADDDAAKILAIFDLDGFKHYNDTFGHPAGDVLLARLGKALQWAMKGRGKAYRLGGDEFCVLATVAPSEVDALLAAARSALTEKGEGFVIEVSDGWVFLGTEASDYESAMRLADQRLYANKNSRRSGSGVETTAVLLKALSERDPELSSHLHGVARLADAVARELRVPDPERSDIRAAAALHDLGKVAIPDAILNKPGPLDHEEWMYMRRHTIIGQRILDASPAMRQVGRIVRASHERFDGTGYPDEIGGDDIPLGARIVFVCDAYHAMTTERPYRDPMTTMQAIDELRRSAGTQFDPLVVEAFASLMESDALAEAPVEGVPHLRSVAR